MQPLRDAHTRLQSAVERLLGVADAVGAVSTVELRQRVREAQVQLNATVVPHTDAEVRVLYPVVDELVGSDGATLTMRLEHEEVQRLTDELGRLADRLEGAAVVSIDLATSLRRVLYGLHALLCIHLAEDEHYVFPVLEMGLSAPESDALLTAVHASTALATAVGQGGSP